MFSQREYTESTTYRMLSTLVATQSNHVNQHFFFSFVQAAQSIPGVEGGKPPSQQAIRFIYAKAEMSVRGLGKERMAARYNRPRRAVGGKSTDRWCTCNTLVQQVFKKILFVLNGTLAAET